MSYPPRLGVEFFTISSQYKNANVVFFYKLDEIGNNANIGIRGFTIWKQKKTSDKMLPPMSIEPLDLWFQVQHSFFWANWGPRIQYSLGSTFCYWIFLFSSSKASNSNDANFGSFEKPRMISNFTYNYWHHMVKIKKEIYVNYKVNFNAIIANFVRL